MGKFRHYTDLDTGLAATLEDSGVLTIQWSRSLDYDDNGKEVHDELAILTDSYAMPFSQIGSSPVDDPIVGLVVYGQGDPDYFFSRNLERSITVYSNPNHTDVVYVFTRDLELVQ